MVGVGLLVTELGQTMISQDHSNTFDYTDDGRFPANESADAFVSIGVDQITDVLLDGSGSLVIEYDNGGATDQIRIDNFKDLASNRASIHLGDGAQIDAHILYDDLCDKAGICAIAKPQAGLTLDVILQNDKQYDLRFDVEDTSAISKGGDLADKLILSFTDGAKIIFQSAQEMIKAALDGQDTLSPMHEAGSSKFLSQLEVIEELIAQMKALELKQEQNNTQSQDTEIELASLEDDLSGMLASIEPSSEENNSDEAALADQLSQVEPAAGQGGGGASFASGGSSAGGYGFQSEFRALEVTPIEDVGPINPTALQYGIEQRHDEVGLDERDGKGAPETPTAPNDLPELADASLDIDESNSIGLTQSGTLDFSFGADGAGAVSPAGWSVPHGSMAGGYLQSGGVGVLVSATASGYVGTANGQSVFTLTIDPKTGVYTYSQILPFDHADAKNGNDVISLDFGVKITDANGDDAQRILTIRVADDAPTANDDSFAVENAVAGNMTDNDDLSVDDDNTVTQISYKGVDYAVPDQGVVSVQGDHGTLDISSDGNFDYRLHNQDDAFYAKTSSALNPVSADAAGVQSFIERDGINVSVANTGNYDVSWLDTPEGSGIGIASAGDAGSAMVDPNGETLNIDLDRHAQTVTITIAKIDASADFGQHGVDMVITLENGAQVTAEQQFEPSKIFNGTYTFTLDSADFGGLQIASVALSSSHQGDYAGGAFLLNNVTTTHNDAALSMSDKFEYTLSDEDGDSDTATVTFEASRPILRVGENDSDKPSSIAHHHIGGDDGHIVGGAGHDILVGDVGGVTTHQQTQDYNFVFIVDVSGSMATSIGGQSRMSLLKAAVENTLRDLAEYQNGQVKVHITPFSTTAGKAGTFTLGDPNGLADALDYISKLSADGYTNYEAPMQEAIGWLQSPDALGGGAITTTYFISDGEPNRYVNAAGGVASGSTNAVINEITGGDGSNEVAALHALSDEVIGVGINISGAVSRLNIIDSDGASINVKDADDLAAALKSVNPIYKLDTVGGDYLSGGDGDDIIYGDSVNTDQLAQDQGLSGYNGDGWKVFDDLEANNANWGRGDTQDYIRSHADELAAESVDSAGVGRSGGDDVINGGDGNDIIFGQEGNDLIYGGEGNDVLSGGSGADSFIFRNANGQGLDVIRDFSVDEGDVLDFSGMIAGFDPTQKAINDFVFARVQGNGTILSVDVSGSGDAAHAIDIVALDGINNLDVQALFESGNINVF